MRKKPWRWDYGQSGSLCCTYVSGGMALVFSSGPSVRIQFHDSQTDAQPVQETVAGMGYHYIH